MSLKYEGENRFFVDLHPLYTPRRRRRRRLYPPFPRSLPPFIMKPSPMDERSPTRWLRATRRRSGTRRWASSTTQTRWASRCEFLCGACVRNGKCFFFFFSVVFFFFLFSCSFCFCFLSTCQHYCGTIVKMSEKKKQRVLRFVLSLCGQHHKKAMVRKVSRFWQLTICLDDLDPVTCSYDML